MECECRHNCLHVCTYFGTLFLLQAPQLDFIPLPERLLLGGIWVIFSVDTKLMDNLPR